VTPPALGGKAPLVFTSAGPQPVAGRIIGMVPQALDDTGAALSPNGPASAESGWSPLGRRALPPGGVINTPVGDVELPRPVSGAPRANRVGGVIGPTTGRETEGMLAQPVGGVG